MDIESWEEFRQINQAITRFTDGIEDGIHLKGAVSHICNSGGKKIRPIMLMLSTEVCGAKIEESLDAALAIELIHSASLIHDDLLDMGTIRRGVETAHEKYGNGVAMLAGDYLISKSIELLAPYKKEVVAEFGKAGMRMADGEVIDIKGFSEKECHEEKYFRCIRNKTASLFAASTAMGAYVAGADEEKVDYLREYGERVGVAYQILDDLLEYRKIPTDKHSVQHSTGLVEIYNQSMNPEDATKKVEDRVHEEVNIANDLLEKFPDSPAREKLFQITEYATFCMLP
ncbi:octaprenyl-diphosphate synthase [Methanohalophilus levihalophilus]|uniref:polyprenyl synthetase family protein n=1 Tax=Methanohalophilus levihalophilus TaxID=1431282 RepID=UPI001AE9BB4F|nr:polyprenyl synthetase family protein [Methanohalophilus levihalophilus]MBP2031047.1 octaprenyl-diphosphate synthase [Methanohalophilus levihalophilus]